MDESHREELVKATSSVRNTLEAPNFGSRYLTDDQDVFSHNAWDHVPSPDDQDERVAEALARQRRAPVPDGDKPKYNEKPARHWDLFYKHNAGNFFRDRRWLHLEFPELVAATQEDAGPTVVMEVGCGAGNAIFPLLSTNKNPHLDIIACDYAPRAVQLVKSHALYAAPPAGSVVAKLWDVSSDALPEGVAPGSVDIVVMIFVLSALHPGEWHRAVTNVHKVLKPGGRVVLRDYGRYDLAQLRFKEGRLLDDNFYIRGDKTRVYFFTLDDLSTIFTGSPLPEESDKIKSTVSEVVEGDISRDESPSPHVDYASDTPPELDVALNQAVTKNLYGDTPRETSSMKDSTSTPDLSQKCTDNSQTSTDPQSPIQHPLFSIRQLGVDNRLIVNRKRQLKMHRVWMQGQFIKVSQESNKLGI